MTRKLTERPVLSWPVLMPELPPPPPANQRRNREPETAAPASCEKVRPWCAGGEKAEVIAAAKPQPPFIGKGRTGPLGTEGSNVVQAENRSLPGTAEMRLLLSAALISQKEETSQKDMNKGLLAKHNLQMRDGFRRESPSLPPAHTESERSWQPAGLVIFPPVHRQHPHPLNSCSPMH